MYFFDGIIVVEGKGDVSYLSSFINAEYVILNGYDMPKDIIDYLKNRINRDIIVLTDSDEAGILIENRLRNFGLSYKNRKVDILKCDKHGKHGVAECEKEEILRVLKNDLITSNPFKETVKMGDFSAFGLMDSPVKRKILAEKLHLGFCNSKTLFKRLNYNSITIEQIREILWK